MCSRLYFIMTSLIGWVQAYSHHCYPYLNYVTCRAIYPSAESPRVCSNRTCPANSLALGRCAVILSMSNFLGRIAACAVAVNLLWMPQNLTYKKSTLVRKWLGAAREQAITWSNVDSNPWRHVASPGQNEDLGTPIHMRTKRLRTQTFPSKVNAYV